MAQPEIAASYDVVIVGGAVMGSAVAYFLASDPAFDGSVLVVERDPGYGETATTRSWGGLRQQFSMPENIRMSLYGYDFLKQAPDLLAVAGEKPDMGFKEIGYLFLASAEKEAVLTRNVALQRAEGAAVELLGCDDLAAQFPWLSLEGVVAGGHGTSGEGNFDPSALLQAFRKKAQSLGVTYVADEAALLREGARVTGVALASGGRVAAGGVVNAAGFHAGRLAATAGIALPVAPRKRMTYVFDCRVELPTLPFTIDPSGVVVRPEGRQYIALVSPPEDQDPECWDFDEDWAPFEETIWPAIAARVPAFEAIKPTGAWAGLYDYNAFDQNAILGPHPEVAGLLFCNGFSGHGLQQAAAAGRAIAELICHGAYRSLDLKRFGYARIAAGRPLFEDNVV